MREFELISQLLSHQTCDRDDVTLKAGDDCAATRLPAGMQQVLTTDTLIAGRHFLIEMPANLIAYRALAVNLSDLAAMGAAPAWALLSLNLPPALATQDFIDTFAKGFFPLASSHNLMLIGGNMTQAETLSISLTLIGHTPTPLTRSGAADKDFIFTTGYLGAAALALETLQSDLDQTGAQAIEWTDTRYQAYLCPASRIEFAYQANQNGLINALIDCSDGFGQDAGHLLKSSQAGALIDASQFARAPEFFGKDTRQCMHWMLNGGDEYELIGSCTAANFPALRALGKSLSPPVNVQLVGHVSKPAQNDPAITWKNILATPIQGYNHF